MKTMAARAPGWRRWTLRAAMAALLLPPITLAPYLVSGTEVVKLRNAALLQAPLGSDFDWNAPPPAEFRFDAAPFDPYFVGVARQLKLDALADDWERALAISRHLLGSAPSLPGGAVRADLRATHRAITQRGDGYCADFVRAFKAIASAGGMQVRGWAFSFDGFGGQGHILIEVWNRQLLRWQLLDIFNNYSFAVDDGAPLSAVAFRRMVVGEPARLQMRALDARVRPGYEIREKAIAYYQGGHDEWYMFWGSNVLEVEGSAGFRAAAPLSYILGQAAATAQGLHPGVRPLVTPSNGERIEALQRTRTHLFVVMLVSAVGSIALVTAAVSALRRAVSARAANA